MSATPDCTRRLIVTPTHFSTATGTSMFSTGSQASRRSLPSPLPAGQLRLRASWFGTAAAAEHPDAEFSGEDLSPERITFDLWPVA